MRMHTARVALAAILVAILAGGPVAATSAQAGMNNIAVNPALPPHVPAIPDVRPRSITIESHSRLNCHPVRERDERGVWVTRTRCN